MLVKNTTISTGFGLSIPISWSRLSKFKSPFATKNPYAGSGLFTPLFISPFVASKVRLPFKRNLGLLPDELNSRHSRAQALFTPPSPTYISEGTQNPLLPTTYSLWVPSITTNPSATEKAFEDWIKLRGVLYGYHLPYVVKFLGVFFSREVIR